MSGSSGSSGLGSLSNELIEIRTLLSVNAGDHLSLSISRQITPVLLILG